MDRPGDNVFWPGRLFDAIDHALDLFAVALEKPGDVATLASEKGLADRQICPIRSDRDRNTSVVAEP